MTRLSFSFVQVRRATLVFGLSIAAFTPPDGAALARIQAEQPALAPDAASGRESAAALPLDGPGLRAQFGAPDFIRREGDSEIWRYDSAQCAVFFFLLRAGEMLRVRYADTLPRDMEMRPDAACIDMLQHRPSAESIEPGISP